MPGERYVYLLRDGVDVAVSYVHAGIYGSVEEVAERWVRSQRCWEAFRGRISEMKRMAVRYEDLVVAPDETTASVASHLGIPERETVADVEAILGDVTRRPHHKNVTEMPNPNSIGKGRKFLSELESQRLTPMLSGWLERCGYQGI